MSIRDELAELGWTLTHSKRGQGEELFACEKSFPGSPKPAIQASATERGILQAVKAYDRHKAGDAAPTGYTDVHQSNIAHGTLNTETY